MTEPAPLVSIVIPAYNHARYLDQAIRSVLAQDYPRVELVVIDDGSTDETPRVLEQYADRFTIVVQKNSGQAATLNSGWSLAKGCILGYLSADDVLSPQAVSSAVAVLLANPRAVAVYPDFILIDPNSAAVRTIHAADFDYRRALTEVECPPGPGALFRRSALQMASGWNTSLRQMPDYDFWLRLGLFGEFIHIRRVLASFRVHPDSQTFGAVEPVCADEPIKIITAILTDQRVPADIAALRDVALGNANIVSAQLHLRSGRFRESWQRIGTAYVMNPRGIVSVRFARALANAVVNRAGHKMLWTLRAMFKPAK